MPLNLFQIYYKGKKNGLNKSSINLNYTKYYTNLIRLVAVTNNIYLGACR